MPARTLNDFFAGFFVADIKANPEAKMTMTLRKNQGDGDLSPLPPGLHGKEVAEMGLIVSLFMTFSTDAEEAR